MWLWSLQELYSSSRRYQENAEIVQSRRRMGAVVETPSIYLDMTAKENIRRQYQILGIPSEKGINELLQLVGLSIAKVLTEKMGGNIDAAYSAGYLSIQVIFQEK